MASTIKKSALAAILLASGLWCSAASAITGNEWHNLTESERIIYLTGIVDSWRNIATATGGEKPNTEVRVLATMVNCMGKGMNYRQVNAIVEKHMEKHPEDWNSDMAAIVWLAMFKVCVADRL